MAAPAFDARARCTGTEQWLVEDRGTVQSFLVCRYAQSRQAMVKLIHGSHWDVKTPFHGTPSIHDFCGLVNDGNGHADGTIMSFLYLLMHPQFKVEKFKLDGSMNIMTDGATHRVDVEDLRAALFDGDDSTLSAHILQKYHIN